jgi:methyl-accepting chemotaxis protein
MNKNLTFQMIMSFMIVVAIATAGFVISIVETNMVSKGIKSVSENDIPEINQTSVLSYNTINKVSLTNSYYLTGADRLYTIYMSAVDANKKIESELLASSTTQREKELISNVIKIDEEFTGIVNNEIMPKIKSGDKKGASDLITGKLPSYTTNLVTAIGEYKKFKDESINADMKSLNAKAQLAMNISIIAAILSAAIGILIGSLSAKRISKPVIEIADVADRVANGDLTLQVSVTRDDEIGKLSRSFNTMIEHLQDLIRQIGENSSQVASASEQLTASAGQSAQAALQVAESISEVADGAVNQSKASNETTGLVEEISASIEEISASVQEVADQSSKTAEKAKEGGLAVDKAVKQMAQIESTVNTSASVVTRLGERSQEIGQIVDTISDIADQTNLLALNAAIEAARAGEQGKGFAVVAEEVRKLAEQSQDATKKIAQLVLEIQSDTSNAVNAMKDGTREVRIGAEVVDNAGVSFKEIVDMVEFVSNQVQEITKTVEQVAGASELIVDSVKIIDSLSQKASEEAATVSAATEEQSASMDEILSSSQSLSELSEDLQVSISKFRI